VGLSTLYGLLWIFMDFAIELIQSNVRITSADSSDVVVN
jgi:hypothetical protein